MCGGCEGGQGPADLFSVCQLSPHCRDQTYNQGKRDHEVRSCPQPEVRQLNDSREDDSKWPEKNKDGRQELEIRLGNEHISFEVCQLESG